MSSKDPVDEADEETFPASDAPTFSTAHAGPPPERTLRILIEAPVDSADAA